MIYMKDCYFKKNRGLFYINNTKLILENCIYLFYFIYNKYCFINFIIIHTKIYIKIKNNNA